MEKASGIKDTRLPILIGDVGGTNGRLSIVRMTSKIGDVVEEIKSEVLPSRNFNCITEMLKKFLEEFQGTANYPVAGVIGIPGPVSKNSVSIIANLTWPETNGEQVARMLKMKKFLFINDFNTNGYGLLSNLKEGVDFERLNQVRVDDNGVIAMIGAGTGLGHGYLTKDEFGGKYYNVFSSEGGHQDFAPESDLQWRYRQFLSNFYQVSHVSVERACAGPAIPVMLRFLIESEQLQSNVFRTEEEINKATSEEIIQLGLQKKCQVCVKVIELFVTIYAAAAGNICLLLLPSGGIYLLGGISVVLTDYLIKEPLFLETFKRKGRLEPLLNKIPIFVVKNSFIGVKGAQEVARRQLEIIEKQDKFEKLGNF